MNGFEQIIVVGDVLDYKYLFEEFLLQGMTTPTITMQYLASMRYTLNGERNSSPEIQESCMGISFAAGLILAARYLRGNGKSKSEIYRDYVVRCTRITNWEFVLEELAVPLSLACVKKVVAENERWHYHLYGDVYKMTPDDVEFGESKPYFALFFDDEKAWMNTPSPHTALTSTLKFAKWLLRRYIYKYMDLKYSCFPMKDRLILEKSVTAGENRMWLNEIKQVDKDLTYSFSAEQDVSGKWQVTMKAVFRGHWDRTVIATAGTKAMAEEVCAAHIMNVMRQSEYNVVDTHTEV